MSNSATYTSRSQALGPLWLATFPKGADASATINQMLASGQVKATRLPAAKRRAGCNLQKRRGGGTVPAHLNPCTMGESPEEREALEEELRADCRVSRTAPSGRRSRKIRRAL